MNKMIFKAYAVTNEIDLNKIAAKCGIPKKYTWEEPLILQGELLGSILQTKTSKEQKVLLFSFGSVVFINTGNESIEKFMKYLKTIKSDINLRTFKKYSDDYELHIGNVEEIELTDEYVIVPKFKLFYPELISIVIAKSVALEKIEEQMNDVSDKLENMIDRLEKGKLRVSNKEMAYTTSKIVRYEYNTIAYVMILDQPDITWVNSEASEFYQLMSEFFELNDRYEVIKKKTDIFKSIIDGFSSISNSIRGLFVEWIIVILIVVEVLLMVVDLFR